MGLGPIRTGIVTNLAAIPGLYTAAQAPAKVRQTPLAYVTPAPEGGEYWQNGGGLTVHHLQVTLLVSLAQGHERAQQQLDPFIAKSGASSVKAAIEADPTLGGAATDCKVSGYRQYDGYEHGGELFLGARFPVEVYE